MFICIMHICVNTHICHALFLLLQRSPMLQHPPVFWECHAFNMTSPAPVAKGTMDSNVTRAAEAPLDCSSPNLEWDSSILAMVSGVQ